MILMKLILNHKFKPNLYIKNYIMYILTQEMCSFLNKDYQSFNVLFWLKKMFGVVKKKDISNLTIWII